MHSRTFARVAVAGCLVLAALWLAAGRALAYEKRHVFIPILLSLALALLLAGCPKGMCLLKVCHNGQCSCPVSTCVEGAEFDVGRNGCVCAAARIPLGGQCLTREAANAFCGRGYVYGERGCVRLACAAGEEIDEATGRCLPKSTVDAVAQGMGVEVGAGEKLGCPPGYRLVIDGDKAACVPPEQICAPDEIWSGQACVKAQQCPPGWAWDVAKSGCVQFARGGDEKPAVDVAQWAQANYGPDGGSGAPAFCSQLARKPWSFGVAEGQSTLVQVAVMLAFPGGEVAQAAVKTAPSYAVLPGPVPPKGVAAVEQAAEAVLAPLRAGGGRATAEALTTTVKCMVVNAAKPMTIPASGGV
ncbi:MAG: hypothetical protein HY744_21125 [Deltaproteobacteria bacterium]|nr:hypothetical protein [Deltaproteobacteria bacterium]